MKVIEIYLQWQQRQRQRQHLNLMCWNNKMIANKWRCIAFVEIVKFSNCSVRISTYLYKRNVLENFQLLFGSKCSHQFCHQHGPSITHDYDSVAKYIHVAIQISLQTRTHTRTRTIHTVLIHISSVYKFY